jgi:hypothetical protein
LELNFYERELPMHELVDEIFNEGLEFKMNGGVELEVFVSDDIYLGGLHGSRSHQPFVAIGPKEWEGEEELTFFKNEEELRSFIDKLQEAGRKAFNESK